MSNWVNTQDRLPCLDGKEDHNCSVTVLVFNGFYVTFADYGRNMYAKTERGRAPKWTDRFGRIAGQPTHWMPLPAPPSK